MHITGQDEETNPQSDHATLPDFRGVGYVQCKDKKHAIGDVNILSFLGRPFSGLSTMSDLRVIFLAVLGLFVTGGVALTRTDAHTVRVLQDEPPFPDLFLYLLYQ